jgi:hypothetical protein
MSRVSLPDERSDEDPFMAGSQSFQFGMIAMSIERHRCKNAFASVISVRFPNG